MFSFVPNYSQIASVLEHGETFNQEELMTLAVCICSSMCANLAKHKFPARATTKVVLISHRQTSQRKYTAHID